MTDKRKAALDAQPDFHSHYEIHGKWAQRHRETIREAMQAKPVDVELIWKKLEDQPYDTLIAETPFGDYRLEWKGWKKYKDTCIMFNGDFICSDCSPEGAQDVALEHYKGRISKIPQSGMIREPVDAEELKSEVRRKFEGKYIGIDYGWGDVIDHLIERGIIRDPISEGE